MADQKYYYAAGRRKTSIAKVYLEPTTKAALFEVNGKPVAEYFHGEYIGNVESPLALVEMLGKFNVKVVVFGGGFASQSDAVRHGVARALEVYNESFRIPLKAAGYLTRDPRRKERKKFGLKKARKSPSWSKR